jgi:hypothetical protein
LFTVPAWLVSLVLHLALLILLALWTAAQPEVINRVLISAGEIDPQEAFEQLAELDFEDLRNLPDVPSADMISVVPDVGITALGDVTAAADMALHFDAIDVSWPVSSFDEIGSLFGRQGKGLADIGDGLAAAATFFGARAKGQTFVFVVDNSNSMGQGRFETALVELARAVDAMTPEQKFFVIFFSDTAYRLFHPAPASDFVEATDRNKERLKKWLSTVQMCFWTRGEEAIREALSLEPDVIYILGDGAFTDNTTDILTAPHYRPTPIHTVGMEVDQAGERQLQAIAKSNHGTYRFVNASAQAKRMARSDPIPRNRIRGPVWGIKLPPVEIKRR